MALTKTELIEIIANELNIKPPQAKDTLEDMIEILKTTLVSGEDIMVSGFGKFQVKEKKPRKGRNPATGETMILPARRVVTFKVAGKLKDKMNLND